MKAQRSSLPIEDKESWRWIKAYQALWLRCKSATRQWVTPSTVTPSNCSTALYAGQVRQRRQLRLGTQAGCSGHGHRAIAQRQQVANDGLAVGFRMGVEFEQPLPACGSQHVQR